MQEWGPWSITGSITTRASSPVGGSFSAKAPCRLGSIEYLTELKVPSASDPRKDSQPAKLASDTPLALYLRLKGLASGSLVLIRAAAWSRPCRNQCFFGIGFKHSDSLDQYSKSQPEFSLPLKRIRLPILISKLYFYPNIRANQHAHIYITQ